ncbi:MAG: GvpL/GvpF family gas vesicle protein [Actinobacteria bacterium]|nr:MAG: GvpL/GvpF family gas vesicle protein [Actinomycetota bacterium]
MTTQAKPKYVYGVTPRTASALRGTGIRRRRLHAIEDGQLAAIVSDAPEGDIQAGREELLTHARVLGRARAQGVVLPMRFGVVMPDEDAVRRELLEEYRDELLLQLREVDGKGELRLRAVYDEDALMKEIVEAHSDIAALSAALRGRPADALYYERIELGQKVARAVEQAAIVDLSAIVDALEPLAVAVQVGEPDHEHVAANVSFLVEDAQIPAFDQAVDALGRQNAGRLTFKYTGPLPPYSFVELPAHG